MRTARYVQQLRDSAADIHPALNPLMASLTITAAAGLAGCSCCPERPTHDCASRKKKKKEKGKSSRIHNDESSGARCFAIS